jgi:predicted acylesterase/phospholipase RssA
MQRRSFLTVATVAAASSVPRAASATAGPSIGFALGSGALHSWAHVGIVRGCARVGLRPQAIAASGVGAVVGALRAAGKSADEIVSVAQRLKWPSTAPGLTALLGTRRRNDALREEIDVHHLMRRQLDVDALIEAGEAALLQLAPKLAPR